MKKGVSSHDNAECQQNGSEICKPDKLKISIINTTKEVDSSPSPSKSSFNPVSSFFSNLFTSGSEKQVSKKEIVFKKATGTVPRRYSSKNRRKSSSSFKETVSSENSPSFKAYLDSENTDPAFRTLDTHSKFVNHRIDKPVKKKKKKTIRRSHSYAFDHDDGRNSFSHCSISSQRTHSLQNIDFDLRASEGFDDVFKNNDSLPLPIVNERRDSLTSGLSCSLANLGNNSSSDVGKSGLFSVKARGLSYSVSCLFRDIAGIKNPTKSKENESDNEEKEKNDTENTSKHSFWTGKQNSLGKKDLKSSFNSPGSSRKGKPNGGIFPSLEKEEGEEENDEQSCCSHDSKMNEELLGSLSSSKEIISFLKVLGIFQPDLDSKMEDLVRQLDFYSRNGIPKSPHLLHSPEDGNDLKLEDGWRSLVSSSVNLSEREEQRQSAIWELVETEATYINMLKVITDLFLSCLCNLQNEGILNEINTKKLFNNIQDVYQASLHFWSHCLSPILDETRKNREPFDSTILLDGFCKFEEVFEPYTQYCLEQTNCQLYCKEHARENNYFKAYLAWCETQKECNRLKLVDILVQPMQRITRYSILLKAILRKTDDDHQKSCLNEMISHVDRFVTTVNTALRNRHEEERLKEISKRIDAYEAVDAKDDELSSAVRLHSDLNLLQPMPGCPPQIQRWLLYQGDFKLKDAHTSKADVQVFLFTDFLLVTKITQKKAEKLKIIRPPYRIDYLVVVELKDSSTIGLINVNEWGVAAAAFTLQSGDPKVLKGLLDSLSAAKKQFQDAKHSRDRYIYEYEDEVPHHLPRSPRVGSSRASRVSSLAHSHSGSMDLNEASSYASPGGHHPPSVDLSDVRASSASSEDSFSSHQAEIQRSKSLEGQHSVNSKQDRRLAFPKTPNTLSVIPPYTTGQSLPNLSSDTSNSLRVPTHKQLSPSSRGTSYPPPSPRTLRRCPPVPQSRNPPLIKTRHVTSVVGQTQETLPEGETSKFESDQDEIGRRRLSRVDRLDNRRYHTAGAIDDIKKQDTKDTSIHKRLSWNYGQGPAPPPPPPRESDESSRFLSKHKVASKSVSCESVHSSSGVSSTSSLLRSEYEALENIDDNELEDEDSTVVDMSVNDCTSLKVSPHISTTYICHDDSDVILGVTTSQYITQPLDDPHSSEKLSREAGVKIDVSEIGGGGPPANLSGNHSGTETPLSSSVQITVNESNEQQQKQQQQQQQQKMPQQHHIPPSSPSSHTPSLKRSTSSFSSSSASSSSSNTSYSSSSSSSAVERSLQGSIPKNDSMREILLNDASVETSDV